MSYVIAFAIGTSILAVVIWAIRMLATPQPAAPDPDHVVAIAQDYRCTVCGLRLVVTHAQDETVDAPRHCREDMVPTG